MRPGARHRALNEQDALRDGLDERHHLCFGDVVKVIAAEPAAEHHTEAIASSGLHLGEARPRRRISRRRRPTIRANRALPVSPNPPVRVPHYSRELVRTMPSDPARATAEPGLPTPPHILRELVAALIAPSHSYIIPNNVTEDQRLRYSAFQHLP